MSRRRRNGSGLLLRGGALGIPGGRGLSCDRNAGNGSTKDCRSKKTCSLVDIVQGRVVTSAMRGSDRDWKHSRVSCAHSASRCENRTPRATGFPALAGFRDSGILEQHPSTSSTEAGPRQCLHRASSWMLSSNTGCFHKLVGWTLMRSRSLPRKRTQRLLESRHVAGYSPSVTSEYYREFVAPRFRTFDRSHVSGVKSLGQVSFNRQLRPDAGHALARSELRPTRPNR